MKPPYPDRYFLAILTPKPLCKLLSSLAEGIDGAKWNREKDYHITLRYLDVLEPEKITPIIERISTIRKAPFGVEVSGFDVFDNPKQKILWAKVLSTRKLTALVGDINEKLHHLDFDMPNKPYVPHITMARAKDVRQVKNYINKNSAALRFTWQVDEFYLMKSTRYGSSQEGVPKEYERLATFPLRNF